MLRMIHLALHMPHNDEGPVPVGRFASYERLQTIYVSIINKPPDEHIYRGFVAVYIHQHCIFTSIVYSDIFTSRYIHQQK